jgi:methyl-accepting chemotaxis protein
VVCLSKDQKLLDILTQKCDEELAAAKGEIADETHTLIDVFQQATELLNAGGGAGLVSAFGSIKNFFQQVVKSVDGLNKNITEINQTIANIQGKLTQVRQNYR